MDCCMTSCDSSIILCLFSMMMQQTCCTASDRQGYWQMAWTDSLLDIFMPTVESFYPLQHCSVTWGSCSTHGHGCQPTMGVGSWLNVSSTRSLWSIFVCDIHLPLSTTAPTDWRDCSSRKKLVPSSLPYTGLMINYTCPMTHKILEWLGVSVEML
jgi:hypothetical protein